MSRRGVPREHENPTDKVQGPEEGERRPESITKRDPDTGVHASWKRIRRRDLAKRRGLDATRTSSLRRASRMVEDA